MPSSLLNNKDLAVHLQMQPLFFLFYQEKKTSRALHKYAMRLQTNSSIL